MQKAMIIHGANLQDELQAAKKNARDHSHFLICYNPLSRLQCIMVYVLEMSKQSKNLNSKLEKFMKISETERRITLHM